MGRSLPNRPNLEQLRKQAKDLLKAHKQADVSACPTLRHLIRFSTASDGDILKAKLVLSEAQHALAIEYGFKNWAALARGVKEGPMRRQEDSLHKVVVESMEKSRGWSITVRGTGKGCKCRLCDEPATTHVTDRSGGTMVEHHYCEKHAWETLTVQAGGHNVHLIPFPVRYTVTVSLTQDQLDREETVRVTLPDGCVVQSPVFRGATGPFAAIIRPMPEAAAKYSVRFVLKIIPPAEQR